MNLSFTTRLCREMECVLTFFDSYDALHFKTSKTDQGPG